MLFNSLTFILVFLPVALAGFYALGWMNVRWAALWLIVTSFIFYCWWAAGLIFLLGFSITFNFLCGFLILRSGENEKLKSLILFCGICGNLLLLFYYKYFFPLLNWFGLHGFLPIHHTHSILLPLGISFFSFTQIGYLVDCRAGLVKRSNFLDYCLFVSFFPHLIAGPILHHREILPQFANPETYVFRFRNIALGATLFIIGLAKKDFIADRVALQANVVFDGIKHPSVVEAWYGVLSYSLQLYFDFSGYSDMAIGLALLFGVRFPANFDSPYRSASIIDFWKRWHMTLTRYITLYLYNPVALWISRRRAALGKSVSRKASATMEGFLGMIAFPTVFTMALAGIWHGAGLQFLIFGLLHGIYLTVNHAYRNLAALSVFTPTSAASKAVFHFGCIVLTYLAVVVAQVFFRASSTHSAFDLLQGMTGFHGLATAHPYAGDTSPFPGSKTVAFVLFAFAIVWFLPNSLQILRRYEPSLSKLTSTSVINFAWRPNLPWAAFTAFVAFVGILHITGVTEFIYFRF